VLVPDGAFDEHGVFVAADPPDDEDVRKLLLRAGRRVVALLRRFFGDDDARRREIDGLLEALDATSATPAPALFPRTERRAALSAFVEGFSLHAATRVMASDRRGLWRLCAYGARGALAASRLSELPDGRFAYAMKRPLPDGRARLVLTGVELLEKLVPLIPPTYANLTRFHGVFAPTSRLRAKVVPPPPVESPPTKCPPARPAPAPSVETPSPAPTPKPSPPRSAYRLDWAALLKRVFAVDVMACSRCDGPMKVVAFLEEPTVVKAILTHLGLPAEPLPAVNAQAPPTTVEMFEDP
jgi:cell division septation protein DedD